MPEIDWQGLFSDEILYQRIKFFLLGSVKNMEVAEELTQETMAKAWEKTSHSEEQWKTGGLAFCNRQKMSSWTTIRHKGLLIDEDDEQWESNIASSSSPDQEAFMDLYNALKRLPPSQKQVIELRFLRITVYKKQRRWWERPHKQ